MRLPNKIWVAKYRRWLPGLTWKKSRIPVGWLRKDVLGVSHDEIRCIALWGRGPMILSLCRWNDRSSVVFLVSQRPANRLLFRRNDRSGVVFFDTTKEKGGSVPGYRLIRCDLPLSRQLDEMEIWKWRKDCYDGDRGAPGLITVASGRRRMNVWDLT